MKNTAIIGSGSWGVALGIHMARLGHNIKVWSYLKEEADLINNEKKCKFLPGIDLPDNIIATQNFEECVKDTDYIFHVTPSKVVRSTIKQYKKFVTNQPIIICSKGFELDTLYTLNEIIEEELPNNKVAVFSGPSHAEEVANEVPTAMVIASEDNELLEELHEMLKNENLRIYLSNDIKGVEIGGSLKNIIAFCAGILVSLNLGDNSFAALLTRGLAEISKLGEAMGANKETFYGLSGLGDLIVTCSSQYSRNRKAGMLIGQGKSLEEAKQEVGMVIESIDNIEVAHKLSQIHKIDMPIVNTVYDILYNNLQPKDAVKILMKRNKKFE